MMDKRSPSKDRGCVGKINLGRGYVKQADKMAKKYNKSYGVYKCPHCGGAHLTTKLNEHKYEDLLYKAHNKGDVINGFI